MTSRRKSKRSVSLRSSSFIRLISPFRSKNIAEQGAGEGEGEGEVREVGSGLGAAFSDSQLNVSCKSTDSWRVNVDSSRCDEEKSPGRQNKVRQTLQSPLCQSLGTSRLSMREEQPGGAGSVDLNISSVIIMQCRSGTGAAQNIKYCHSTGEQGGSGGSDYQQLINLY